MKIKNRLYLIFALFLALFILVSITIFYAKSQINKATEQAGIANSIGKNLTDLNMVTYEFLLYHEDRMQQQWYVAYASISKLLKETNKEPGSPEKESILQSISRDVKSIRVLFLKLKALHDKWHMPGSGNESKDKILSQSPLDAGLVSELLVKSHYATLSSLRLHAMAQKEMLETQRKANSVIIISMIVFMLVLLISGAFTIRSIAAPISKLVEGTNVIGKGNFDYEIVTKSRDEIGELAVSFNKMAQNLLAREQALRESEAKYRSLTDDVLDSSEVGIFILDPEFKVVWANQSLERYFGLRRDDIIGKDKRQLIRERIRDIFDDPGSFVQKVFATYDNNTYIENFVCHILPDGERRERWLEHWSQPIRSGLYAGGRIEHYYDITERKRAEEALRERELMIQSLIAHAPYSIWVCNGEGTIIFANQAALELFGVSDPDQIINSYNIFHDITETEKSSLKYFDRAWAGEIVHYNQDLDMTSVNYDTSRQETLHFHTTLFAIPGNGGHKPNIVAIQEDVTERVQAAEHIQHLQNVLMAIRNVNQLIVREKNPQKLLQKTCEILNRTRDYKLVWIGLIQEDSKEIFPAAQVGAESDYLKSIQITWDDSDTGKGPTGTAIRTKKPVIMRDIAGDPSYKPWRENAIKRGYASSAAVPLVHKNRVFGALNVYASIPDSFDEEEMDLLIEVSQDIALALHSIELDKKHKRAETERQKTELRLGTILNSAADAIITIDKHYRILHFNKGAGKIFGYRTEEILGKSLDLLIPSRLAKAHRQHIRDFASEPETTRYMGEFSREVLGRRKDGSEFPADASISKLILDGDTTFTVILRDITELKQTEKSLQKARDELEAKVAERTRELTQANIRLQEIDRLKSEFLATMSHELRTPLNSIIGFTGIIMKGIAGEINDEQKKQLAMVNGSAKHLLSLINDILDLSRIEAGKMELSMKKIKLKEIISEVAQILSPSIFQKGLKLLIEIPEEIPEIYSDRKKVFQILLNLVNNAVKFTDKGEIKIKCEIDNDNLQVSVSDTGAGIKKEDLEYLFEAFRQIDGTAQRKYEGTGLGLHLCRKLTTLLGGTIWAESDYGKGSKFTFTLPLR